jgi:hypothetical protein
MGQDAGRGRPVRGHPLAADGRAAPGRGGACGHRAATGIAFTAALTAALSAVTRDLALQIAPVRVNLIAAGCAGTLPAATRPVGRVVARPASPLLPSTS